LPHLDHDRYPPEAVLNCSSKRAGAPPARRRRRAPAPRRHTALKERERDDRVDEIARLKSKVGEITMDNQLLYAKIEVLEGIHPPQ
jgi:hypothetical protein